MPSDETTVLTVDIDELGDDVDIDLVASHARHGIENNTSTLSERSDDIGQPHVSRNTN